MVAQNNLKKIIIRKNIFLGLIIILCACTDKVPQIHKLAKEGNVKALEQYLEQTENVDFRDKKGETALFTAAFHGKLEAVKLLVKYGADINAKNNNNGTPLIYATINLHEDVIRFFLANGADVNVRDKLLYTVLSWPAIRALSGPEKGIKKNLRIMQLLVNYGADINEKNPQGETLLFDVSVAPKKYLDFLINNGIDINKKNIYGETALFEPTLLGKNEVVLYLLRRGADPQITNIYDESPIDIAKSRGHTEILNNLQRFSKNKD